MTETFTSHELMVPRQKPAARPAPRPVVIRARFDAAETTDENRRHWANADDKSANAANSPQVRAVLRRRARYEAANNPNIGGLIRTIAYDLIGTGPRLVLTAGADDATRAAARTLSRRFAAWCRAARFADKLRVMAAQKPRDGEAFAVMVTNRKLRTPVKLDLRLVEPEQVASPVTGRADPNAVDGVRFDADGNPAAYLVLKAHPGGTAFAGEADVIPADKVIHWFRPDRAGQARGVPEIAPMLPLAAYQRRYMLATVSAAEFAASVSAVLESDLPDAGYPGVPDGEAGGEVTCRSAAPFDRFEYERGAMMNTPAGFKLKQLEAEQPTGTFREFNGELLCAMGRAVDAPFNVMSGNSSGYNYSSGRLDHLGYHRNLWVERERLRDVCLDPVFREWLTEAVLAGEIPDGLPPIDHWDWDWHWDGFGAIDPVKDAVAAQARKDAGISTLAEECAADGKDWEDVARQRAVEKAMYLGLGLPDPYPATTSPNVAVQEAPEEAPEEDPANAA